MDFLIKNIQDNYKILIDKKYIYKKYIDDNYLIHYSIIYNNINFFKDLLNYDKKLLYKKNKFDETILHIASKYKLYDFINYILKLDIKLLDYKDNLNNLCLHYLIDNPNIIIKIFDEYSNKIKNFDLNCISVNKGTLLLNFIKLSDDNNDNIYYKLIEYLINFNINVNVPYNIPPLIYSVKNDKYNITKLLLTNKKIEVNVIDSNNVTSIFYAIKNNYINILKLLIKNKINVNYFDTMNNIQLINFAIKCKNKEVLEILLSNEINVNIYDNTLNLPINYAIKNNIDKDIIKKLLIKTNNLNIQNVDGNTTLHYLIKYKNWYIFEQILLKKELDIFIENKEKKSILNLVKNKKKIINLVAKSYIIYAKNNNDDKSKFIKKICNKKLDSIKCIKIINDYLKKIKSNILINDNIKFNIISNKFSKFNIFNPIYIYINFLYLYLCKKYDNIIFPYLNKIYKLDKLENKKNNLVINKINNWINLNNKFGYKQKYMDIYWYDKNIYWINPFFKKAFLHVYKKKRYIIISLILINKDTNHQNILIYDNKKNILERFEPYGVINNSNSIDLDNFIFKYFKNFICNLKYNSPSKYMNRIGFQNISENENKIDNLKIGDPIGYCVGWCFWYVEMKISNSNLNSVTLINKSIKYIINNNNSFTEYIRNYSNNLFLYLKKIFLENNLSENILLYKNLNKKNLNLIYKLIKKKIKKIN